MSATSPLSKSELRRLGALIVTVVALSIYLWIDSEDPQIAKWPLLLVVVAWVYARAPLHWIGTGLFFLAIVTDNPKEHPAQGRWESPLSSLGVFFYDNLNTTTGISALRFSGMDVALVWLLLALAWRRSEQRNVVPMPGPMRIAAGLIFIGLIVLEGWGIARGGDFKSSLWQLRPPIWYAGITFAFAGTIRDARDLRPIGVAVVTAAMVKVAEGFYVYRFICRPLNIRPDYVTTHSDSVLFVSALVIVGVTALEGTARRSFGARVGTFVMIAACFLGIVINGRRLAYIELFGACTAIYMLSSNRVLRAKINRIVAWSALPVAGYLAVGWHSKASVFAPAAKIASLFNGDDRSSGTRDIENFNLIVTWKEHPFLGSGMGQPYSEVSVGDSIAEYFPLYRFIGHDSVLWLFAVGGLIGFALVWMSLVTGAYFAARAHRSSTDRTQRIAAAAALSGVVCFMVQAYGDMGMQSWTAAFLFAMALAVSGKLAVMTGAWPIGAPVAGPARASTAVRRLDEDVDFEPVVAHAGVGRKPARARGVA